MARRLVAALACRNQGSRLYGKPVQNLDVDRGVCILDNIIDCLHSIACIDEVVLGIAEGAENTGYERIAEARGLRWIRGDETDVLGRLIACGEAAGATDIFRTTSESPFPFFEPVDEAWTRYVDAGADGLFLDDIVDGCGFELLSLDALRRSHREGEERHRSELCTLYMRENHDTFNILRDTAPAELVRQDLRLTVDNPEDLILARAVYQAFAGQAPRIPVSDIVRFLDAHPDLIALTASFTEAGYQTMYIWGKNA
ncbi:MAG: hypothetical protein JJ908_00330 [Rhizobiales bacterium]|nr:hypothetical protein [Hyphomicrobiales bacterium]MBO6698956.1 hypothetical protein [Hyphomicrobiales bacterium]MBO6734791.1 hypothetical protein [Hyphomicrobiales bacterium]MBO6911403.1 hypothetical protein [Hyphomicrobiales bacterium]MBO6955464.1 hypothetical protein [Hyphomicrobiales bacterium]